MTNTNHLGLPFIEGSQAQKHVTHNEALRILDALVQIGVLDAHRTAPPSAPAEGDRHIVASGATGAWAGQAQAIALYEDGGWRFFAPKAGWCAWSAADGVLLVHDGAAWSGVAGGGGGGGTGDSVAKFGVNATATAPNLLTVRSSAALFHAVAAADGGSGDMRLQIAKESAANTASVFFSDAYAGHAEFGLTGDNDFHLKVSADGATWRDAVTFDRATGRASFPGGGVRELLTTNRTYYVRTDGSDSNNGLSNSAGGAFLTIQKAANVIGALDASIYNVTISIGAGTFSEDVKLPAVLGSGVYTLTGAGVASTTIKSIEFLPRSTWKYNNVKLSGGVSLIILGAFSNVRADGPTEYGTATDDHIRMVDAMASWIAESNYTISGGAARHWRIDDGGMIFVYGRTVTLTGTPNFSDRFARAVYGSKIIAGSMTFSGSATGSRYVVSTNGTIGTDGGGANYLPGNAAGYADTGSGGIYT
jgi:hypothetical protein